MLKKNNWMIMMLIALSGFVVSYALTYEVSGRVGLLGGARVK